MSLMFNVYLRDLNKWIRIFQLSLLIWAKKSYCNRQNRKSLYAKPTDYQVDIVNFSITTALVVDVIRHIDDDDSVLAFQLAAEKFCGVCVQWGSQAAV